MNTKIGRIAQQQSHLGGFVPSPERDPSLDSSTSGEDDDDASGFKYISNSPLSLVTKRGSSFVYERVVLLLRG